MAKLERVIENGIGISITDQKCKLIATRQTVLKAKVFCVVRFCRLLEAAVFL